MNDFTAEIKFLISMIRGERPVHFAGFDPDRFLQLLKFHHLEFFAASELSRMPDKEDFRALIDELNDSYLACAAHSIALRHGFREIAALFKANDVSSIVFKGLYFAQHLYPERMRRRFADLDFLIKDEDYISAEKLLLDNGFAPIRGYHSRFKIEDCVELGVSRPFYHKKAHYLQVDLHNRLSVGPGRRFLEPADCWSTAVDTVIEGLPVRTLSTEAGLLHLCWHTLKHSFCRLIWFFDILFFIRKHFSILGEERFHRFVEKYRAQKVVLAALGITAHIFRDSALLDAVDRNFGKFTIIEKGYFSLTELLTPRKEIPSMRRTLRDMKLISRISDKTNYLLNAILPHPRLLPELSPEVKSRLDGRYISSRVKTLFSSEQLLQGGNL